MSAKISGRPKNKGTRVLKKKFIKEWLFKLLNEERLWQQLFRKKYLNKKTLCQVHTKPTESPFWNGLTRVKDNFFSRCHFYVGSGSRIRLWKDVWLGDTPLS
jgi:hypothetical protein